MDRRTLLCGTAADRVWIHDVEAQTMTVLYDSDDHPGPVLSGVDNLAVSAAHDLFVAEDKGDLQVCTITPDGVVAAVVQLVGPNHGIDTGPFRGGTLAAAGSAPRSTALAEAGPTIPATGAHVPVGPAVLAGAVGAALLRLRRRAHEEETL